MDPRYRNPHLKPLGTSTLLEFFLELIPLGVVEVNKLVHSHPSVLSYSKKVSSIQVWGYYSQTIYWRSHFNRT